MALIKAINKTLEIVRKEKQKREKIIEKRITKAISAKYQKARGGISFFGEKKNNYESDTKDDIDLI